MSALIHSPFECGAFAAWLQVFPLPKPRLRDARSIWSNCRRLRHTSSPTVPETSIFSFTIDMKFHHKAAEIGRGIAPKRTLIITLIVSVCSDNQPQGLAARVFPFVTPFLPGRQPDRQVRNLSWAVRCNRPSGYPATIPFRP